MDYIAGRSKEHLEVDKVCRDDQCPLGGWIYGGAQKHAHTHEYKELKTAHAEFHQSVGHIVQSVQNQDQATAKRLLGGEFSKTSKRTISAIDSIEAVAKGKKASASSARSVAPKSIAKVSGSDDGDWEEF